MELNYLAHFNFHLFLIRKIENQTLILLNGVLKLKCNFQITLVLLEQKNVTNVLV